MEHKNPYAPLAMAGVAIPAYATPLVAMSQLGSMFQHANSVGAAFVLLTLGAGVNLGLIAWVFRNYGLSRGLGWIAILLALVIPIAYAIENPLYPERDRAAGAHPRLRHLLPPLRARPEGPARDGPRQAQGRRPPIRTRRADRAGPAGRRLGLALGGSTAAGASRIGWSARRNPEGATSSQVRRRDPGPGAGRNGAGGARRAQRRGMLRLLPSARGGLQ